VYMCTRRYVQKQAACMHMHMHMYMWVNDMWHVCVGGSYSETTNAKQG
jgi:hypothetical protein